jgi:hypothetical protein
MQSTFNPFSRPEVLAACIVPQIEAYLATNTSTRLLILHYSFSHLATVMALRKLLGQDVLKIAGIMDTLSSDPPSIISRPRTPQTHSHDTSQRCSSIASHISSLNGSTNHQPKKSESGVSFSKANYLLPNTATDAEITTFLSGIRMSLMENSTFYTPEPELTPTIVEKPPLPPIPATSTFAEGRERESSHPPVSFRQHNNSQTRESKIARLTGNSVAGTTPPRTPTGNKSTSHRYAPSIASTARTTNSERGRREDARIEKEWENFYIGDEDSEDDDYDRMVMGRSMAKIVPEVRKTSPEKAQKRNTKKALKWLGLA